MAILTMALAGCAGVAGQRAAIPGLTSEPLPQPKSFVVESRSRAPVGYPPVGATPPLRTERPMTASEVKAMDESLRRAGGVAAGS